MARQLQGGIQQTTLDGNMGVHICPRVKSKDEVSSTPSMCCFTVKRDFNIRPNIAKSQIVIFGNHKDRYWVKN